MQLTTSRDIEAPRDAVYAQLTDVDQWERTALRRGADVQRLDPRPAAAPGMSWRAAFPFRGKPREITVTLDRMIPGQALQATATGTALEAVTRLDLSEMSPRRTRVTVTVDITARTLTARLFLQSMRLAQGRVKQRFDSRIAQLASEIEGRLRDPPRA